MSAFSSAHKEELCGAPSVTGTEMLKAPQLEDSCWTFPPKGYYCVHIPDFGIRAKDNSLTENQSGALEKPL